MEGIDGVLTRISALESRLSSLRPPEPGRFAALLDQSRAAAAPTTASAVAPGQASAWSVLQQRPAALQPAAVQEALRTAAVPGVGASVGTYPNGRIPDSALTSIGGADRLQPAAAAGFLQMEAAAARDGVTLPVNDSYRSFAEQVDMATRKGLYSQGGFAAKPGTSTHGLGLSVDLQLDDRSRAWMRQNAKQFGFVEDVPREPWHWTYKP